MVGVFAGIAAFAAALTLYGFSTRVFVRANRVFLFVVIGSACGVLLIAFQFLVWNLSTIEFLEIVLTYAFLCELFLEAMTASMASVAASLLLRLRRMPMREEEISDLYAPEFMVSVRLDRMLNSGFIEDGGEGLILTARGARAVRLFDFLQKMFRHGDREHAVATDELEATK